MERGGDGQAPAFVGPVVHEDYSPAVATQDQVLPVLLAEAKVDAGFVALAEEARLVADHLVLEGRGERLQVDERICADVAHRVFG